LTQRNSEKEGIPTDQYEAYKNDIKQSKDIFDEYLMGNKSEIQFDRLDIESLNIVLGAAFNLAMAIKNSL